MFFDAHNHLQALRFGGRQAELLAECPDVARMVVNGCCEEDWPAVAALAEAHRQVLPSFGYHPWCIHERSDAHPAAVGEIGLDRWKEGLNYEGQEDVFVTQLRIAAERNLPASIHCLKAWGRILELLQEGPIPERGFLLHSYGGPTEMVQAFAQLGAYFSFPGYFLRAAKGRHREAFKSVPADRLLIETDAPDQRLPDALNAYPLTDSAGEPMNHPANLPVVYQGVAKILETPLVALAEQVEDNFERLFGN